MITREPVLNATHHLGLVTALADRFINLGCPMNERDDLIGEGQLALAQEVGKFSGEPKDFANFASQRIARAMLRYLRSCHHDTIEYVGNEVDLDRVALNLRRPIR
ncbi:MAG: hypothetical protein GF393_05245 [Armatimonadia bacterium]|nr:hypothetical protein [Armatimonadia bacterium]